MKKYTYILCILFVVAVLTTCKKTPEIPSGNKIEIGVTTINSVSYYTATAKTVMISTGDDEISQHGHCWSMAKEPTIENNKTTLGKLTQPKTYTSELTNLQANTKYYIRSYVTYKSGTLYGNEQNILTPKTGKPVVSTNEASNITLTSATCGGNVTADSGLLVTIKGVCWDTTANVNIENNIGSTSNGDSLGTFTSNITGLTEGLTYFVKAYSTNAKGTSYGDIVQFTTVPVTLPVVITSGITDITINSAICGGNVTSNGNGSVTARGICWNTTGNPTLSNNIGYTSDGNGLGNFASNITGLADNVIYYISSYATNEKGTSYGAIQIFTTLELLLPEVETTLPTNITTNSAQTGGNVVYAGNGTIISRGVCWNTTDNPTLENCLGYTTEGIGLGNFISNITDLVYGTTYYVTAYVTNEKGNGYGEIMIFQTIPVTFPLVITTEVSNITTSSAQCGGEVTDAGNGTIAVRGICWDTQLNPTLENNEGFTTDGNGVGEFTSYLSGLPDGTVYYVIAYASNEKGTGYGEVLLFETFESCGTVNHGGETYSTIVIGSQCWIDRNLNIGQRIFGVLEQQDNETIEKYCIDNVESNCDEFGGIYQWDEMMQYTSQEGAQGICPVGWHIPTDDEWKQLEMYLGMSQWEADRIGAWRGTDEGKKLKATSGWGINGTDAVGFNAIPGASRWTDGAFYNLGNGFWWSSSLFATTHPWFRILGSGDGVYRGYANTSPKEYGYSVRCVKD